MDQPKIERVLRLMRMMAGNAYFTVDELADKLDTSYRSIYRYIDTFRQCGFAVEKVHGNVYHILKMPTGFKDIENLVYFSEEEARIVNSLIDSLSDTNALKTNLHRKLTAVYDVADIEKYFPENCNAANIQALGNAARDKKQVVLKNYASANSNSVRDRLVEPYGFTPGHIDVWAYDIEKKENRQYKVSRIEWVDILPDDWQFEDLHQKKFLDAFRMSGDDQIHVRLELTIRAKDLLCEEFPLAIPDISEGKKGKWIFDSNVSKLEGVGRFVLGLAKEIDIIDSPELVKYVRKYAAENYSKFD